MLTITLTPSASSVVSGFATDPAGKSILVPINGVDTATDSGNNPLAIQYGTPQSSDPNVNVSLVPVTNYVDFNLTFKDSTNTSVTGDVVVALFGNSAPTTVAQIVSLVSQGKYNGETFGYVQDGFVAFAGYNSTGTGQVSQGSQLNDEFNTNLTFTSPGLLAMGNAGPDTGTSLFFITGIDNQGGSASGGTPVSLVNMPQALNNRYPIFGQLVSGFDVFEKLMTTPGSSGTPTSVVTINTATIVADNQDAVLMISAPAGYTGHSATITLPATDSGGGNGSTSFSVNTVFNTADGTSGAAAANDQPFLGPVAPVSTPQGQATQVTLTAADPQGLGVTFSMTETDSQNSVTLTPLSVTFTDTNGQASESFTITPNGTFTGSVSLQASVITASGALSQLYVNNAAGVGSQYAAATNNPTADTQAFVLTVNPPAAPGAPTGLQVSFASATELDLGWTAATGTVTGYNVFRGTAAGGESSTPLNSTPLASTATTYQDTTVAPGTTYYYRVQAVNSTVSSSNSNEASGIAVNAAATSPATNLQVSVASATELDLAWTAATGNISGYNVFRGTTAGGESSTPINSSPLSSATTTYQDTTVTTGTTYFYTVQAVNNAVASLSSNEASGTPSSTPSPSAPSQLKVSAPSATELDLSWLPASGTVTGYNVFRGGTAGGESGTPLNSTPLAANATSYQDTTVAAGTTYYYTVQAVDNAAAGPSSNEVNATAGTPAVPTGLVLDVSSANGLFTNDNYTSQASVVVDATAAAGTTETFTVNGKTFTATANSSGMAQVTLPAGSLAVGANSITATATNLSLTSAASSPLIITYVPNYTQVYTVPGSPGSSQTLTVNWTTRQAGYNDEIGVYEVSDVSGTVNNLAPGAAGYDQAAIGGTSSGGQFQAVVFPSGDKAGATMTLSVTGGELLAFYMIQNNTTANFLAKNPTNGGNLNSSASQPGAFFTTTAANPDGGAHVKVVADPSTGTVQYAWEDLNFIAGSDKDYNDVVMTVALAAGQTANPSTLHVPDGGSGNNVKVNATLASGTHDSVAPGDVGVYFVDNAAGSIGSLTPGSSGYLAAALASGNTQVLIASGATAGTAQSITVPAGKYLAFYSISTGTTANFLATNASNDTATAGLANAFLSFAAANPSQINHFSFTSPEGVASDPSKTQLHLMDEVLGTTANFDDLMLDLSFAAG